MADDCDVLVIGAGIVGLSTAYALTRAAPGIRVVVLEKEPGPAQHQTGRNSGVIHSGLYYRPGSLKARYAVQGATELVAFCAEHGLPHAVTGKIVVATDRDELPRLHALAQRGRENGIPVRELGPAQITEYEPHVRGLAALHVATTGVCDFRAVARTLAELAREAGAEVRYGVEVRAIARRPGGARTSEPTAVSDTTHPDDTTGPGTSVRPTDATCPADATRPADATGPAVAVRTAAGDVVRARALVNCAGLHSDRIARIAGDRPGLRIIPFRGEYYELAPHAADLVRGLVYPVPDPAFPFLGIHLTRGIDGAVHLGPNAVPALAREGYSRTSLSPRDAAATVAYPGSWRIARRHWRYGAGELRRSLSRRAFTRDVRRLLPAVDEKDLRPAQAGVRAQAVLPDGALVDDFRFAEGPRTIHVLNAPSPAATASLPIGREIARRTLALL
ncbi:L-2-hydroxyglutarate oxidase [Streptomyces sp. CMB-StM0423]|uniref:L-2-hydroxyglutarate oxidase n=1 Tax=Streptomyces sp. CMB-StM0423 TaxID=2059884 RepID=UPI000C70612E|nr:L-2-hydroxyglutarate oxidase [Streptomyces sp. CMB-StM0423]AUH41339.1 L-2-hydroxyglutarate oxidase [Streptomyces sp. CMB-StM0423]